MGLHELGISYDGLAKNCSGSDMGLEGLGRVVKGLNGLGTGLNFGKNLNALVLTRMDLKGIEWIRKGLRWVGKRLGVVRNELGCSGKGWD